MKTDRGGLGAGWANFGLWRFVVLLSLFLCMCCCFVWIRETVVFDNIWVGTWNGTEWNLFLAYGDLEVFHYDHWPQPLSFRYFSGKYGIVEDGAPSLLIEDEFGRLSEHDSRWHRIVFSRGSCAAQLIDGTGEVNFHPIIEHVTPAYQGGGSSYTRPMLFWAISSPIWPVATLLAVLPAFAGLRLVIRQLRLRRRRRAGRCIMCGYDLRFSSGRCPECGSALAGSG